MPAEVGLLVVQKIQELHQLQQLQEPREIWPGKVSRRQLLPLVQSQFLHNLNFCAKVLQRKFRDFGGHTTKTEWMARIARGVRIRQQQ